MYCIFFFPSLLFLFSKLFPKRNCSNAFHYITMRIYFCIFMAIFALCIVSVVCCHSLYTSGSDVLCSSAYQYYNMQLFELQSPALKQCSHSPLASPINKMFLPTEVLLTRYRDLSEKRFKQDKIYDPGKLSRRDCVKSIELSEFKSALCLRTAGCFSHYSL